MSRNLRSSLSLWFFGSSGREEANPPSRAERLLWFTLLLAVSYGLVWLVFQVVAPGYRKVLAETVERICAVRGQPFEFDASGSTLKFRSNARPSFEADLSTKGIDANVPFLLALLLMTPGINLTGRGARVAAGLVLLFFSQALFVVTKVEVTLIAAQHPLAGTSWLWSSVDNFLEITGKAFFPVMIWLLLCLPYMMGRIDRPPAPVPAGKPGRNAPCPCGSGKKYKHCCGG